MPRWLPHGETVTLPSGATAVIQAELGSWGRIRPFARGARCWVVLRATAVSSGTAPRPTSWCSIPKPREVPPLCKTHSISPPAFLRDCQRRAGGRQPSAGRRHSRARPQAAGNMTGLDSPIADLKAAFPDRRRDHPGVPFGVGGHCLPGADLSNMPLETAGVIRVQAVPSIRKHSNKGDFSGRYTLPSGGRIQSRPSQIPEATPHLYRCGQVLHRGDGDVNGDDDHSA